MQDPNSNMEPVAKRRKSKATQPPTIDELPTIMTEPTYDENIFPDATYQSYDEFERKFNTWKAKYLHPFRVASSETLRTEEGLVSEKFKYRYVVYHCARYGVPRMRGEGKRPNQNYLPCKCQAMIRLNFNFSEQCLKLTSLETRHSNHGLDKDLYDRMQVKEVKRKAIPSRRRTIAAPMSQSMEKSDQNQDERAESERSTASHSPEMFVPQYLPVRQPFIPPLAANTSGFAPPISSSFQALRSVQIGLLANAVPYNFSSSNWTPIHPTSSQSASIPSSQISPVSSTVDENEAPKQFHTMDAVRPIPLHPSQNIAFTQMIHESTRVSPIPKAEIESILASASRMLLDVNLPQDVLQNRVKDLNRLISEWSH